MRHVPTAPTGTMDFLFASLLLYSRKRDSSASVLAWRRCPGWRPCSRAGLASLRQAALRSRRALLQLSGSARVQGQIRSGVGGALSRSAWRHGAAVRPVGHRGADQRRNTRSDRPMRRGAACMSLIALLFAGAAHSAQTQTLSHGRPGISRCFDQRARRVKSCCSCRPRLPIPPQRRPQLHSRIEAPSWSSSMRSNSSANFSRTAPIACTRTVISRT